jgi:hypothetical protein
VAVYVDALQVGFETDAQARRVGERHNHQWCHLWADSPDELHEMAQRIGMRRSWFQDKKGRSRLGIDFPHYDLVPSRRARAVRLGAQEASLRKWIAARLRERKATD